MSAWETQNYAGENSFDIKDSQEVSLLAGTLQQNWWRKNTKSQEEITTNFKDPENKLQDSFQIGKLEKQFFRIRTVHFKRAFSVGALNVVPAFFNQIYKILHLATELQWAYTM